MAKETTVVYCPSYCLYKDGSRLCAMSEATTRKAAKLVASGEAEHVIFSTAYEVWQKEAYLKLAIARAQGVNGNSIHILEYVTNTYNEADKTLATLEKIGNVGKMIIVAETYHLKRALKSFMRRAPGLILEPRSVETPIYEVTLEPFPKNIRAGYKTLWRIWHRLFYMLPF